MLHEIIIKKKKIL